MQKWAQQEEASTVIFDALLPVDSVPSEAAPSRLRSTILAKKLGVIDEPDIKGARQMGVKCWHVVCGAFCSFYINIAVIGYVICKCALYPYAFLPIHIPNAPYNS